MFNDDPKYKIRKKLFVDVTSDETVINKVLCDIRIPRHKTDSITTRLYPQPHQYELFKKLFLLRFRGSIIDMQGDIQEEIICNEAYIKRSDAVTWSANLIEHTIDLSVFSLEIIDHLNEKQEGHIYCYFWITDCVYLMPNRISLDCKHSDPFNEVGFEFDFPDNNKIMFVAIPSSYTNSEKETISFYEQMGYLKCPCDSFNIEISKAYLSDFLLLTSFASRKHVDYIEWSSDNQSKRHAYYRKNIDIISENMALNFYGELIDYIHYKIFINTVFKEYIGFKNRELIRQAIYITSYGHNSTIEGKVRDLFSAIESLLTFSHLENEIPNSIIEKSLWRKKKGLIRNFIETDLLQEFPPKKTLMVEKLEELNRVSLRTSIELFREYYSLEIDDLWPLYDSNSGVSLKMIRDSIVHGNVVKDNNYTSIMIASEHLQWILERMILAILGWDINKSRVAKHILKIFKPYKDWETIQKQISKL